jgi:hypothetical protein
MQERGPRPLTKRINQAGGKGLRVAELAATWNQLKRKRRGTEYRIFQNEILPFDVNDQNNDCKTKLVFHLTAN